MSAPGPSEAPVFPRPRRLVVGVDGSHDSARAVATAATLAAACGAEVVGVHAVGLMHRIDGEMRPSDQNRERIATDVATWAAPLGERDVPYRTVIEDGPPGLVLLRVVEREEAGLVVLGTRGLGSSEGVVLGSTSHHLVQHSPVPVVVVPHDAALP
ncbi:universal stress protein [Actinomarinicola tropica]|uniref:UspA domain-containing protein n=1 Tax=Actinomarinicola tropica TaxID=2789776 RepID=A0A5Q2RCW5_9ACTN|nr:universal stress protein [Actinomarinicola tropica]QGG94729.1 hypothetical protein GH723_06180 [Actinomarinicola tropica]